MVVSRRYCYSGIRRTLSVGFISIVYTGFVSSTFLSGISNAVVEVFCIHILFIRVTCNVMFVCRMARQGGSLLVLAVFCILSTFAQGLLCHKVCSLQSNNFQIVPSRSFLERNPSLCGDSFNHYFDDLILQKTFHYNCRTILL